MGGALRLRLVLTPPALACTRPSSGSQGSDSTPEAQRVLLTPDPGLKRRFSRPTAVLRDQEALPPGPSPQRPLPAPARPALRFPPLSSPLGKDTSVSTLWAKLHKGAPVEGFTHDSSQSWGRALSAARFWHFCRLKILPLPKRLTGADTAPGPHGQSGAGIRKVKGWPPTPPPQPRRCKWLRYSDTQVTILPTAMLNGPCVYAGRTTLEDAQSHRSSQGSEPLACLPFPHSTGWAA